MDEAPQCDSELSKIKDSTAKFQADHRAPEQENIVSGLWTSVGAEPTIKTMMTMSTAPPLPSRA